jgi:hypothetical protein
MTLVMMIQNPRVKTQGDNSKVIIYEEKVYFKLNK